MIKNKSPADGSFEGNKMGNMITVAQLIEFLKRFPQDSPVDGEGGLQIAVETKNETGGDFYRFDAPDEELWWLPKKSNFEKWMAEYEKQLTIALKEHPGDYNFGLDDIPLVLGRMGDAFRKGTYSKEGLACKATCKVLGIKNTYKVINNYLKG